MSEAAGRSMRRFKFSLSTLALAVALVAVNCAIVRWGLRLPNLMANDLIQPIVVGSAPMVGLLALGLILTVRGWILQDECPPFRLGFLVCGAIGLTAYVIHAYFICRPGQHYSTDYEMAINATLLRCCLTWGSRNLGGDALRHVVVITSLVFLLALPQVIFAVMGGWLAARSRRKVWAGFLCPGIPPA